MEIWEIESDLEDNFKTEIRKELTKYLDLRGDYTVTISGSPGFVAGDIVHIVSQRNALSRADAGA